MTKLQVTRVPPPPVECEGAVSAGQRCTGPGAHTGTHHTSPSPSQIRNMQTQPITHGWGACAPHSHTQTGNHPLVSPSPHTSHPLSWAALEAHHPHPCPHPTPPQARSAAAHALAVLLCSSRSWPLVAAAGLHETAPHMGGRGKAACLRRPPLPRMRGQGGGASVSMECPPPHIAPVRCGRCQNTRRCLPSRSHQRSHTSTQPTPQAGDRLQQAAQGPCPRAPTTATWPAGTQGPRRQGHSQPSTPSPPMHPAMPYLSTPPPLLLRLRGSKHTAPEGATC
jgi:hypothetical protein